MLLEHNRTPSLCMVGWTVFVTLLLLALDADTINPKHDLGGSSALLLAQRDVTQSYSSYCPRVYLLNVLQDQG